MQENAFQAKLIKEIKNRFPGSIVMKNDANYIQGIPDLTVLYQNHWAMLECKREKGASKRPNQSYYVQWAKDNSFGAIVSPENKEEILDAMEQSFRSG